MFTQLEPLQLFCFIMITHDYTNLRVLRLIMLHPTDEYHMNSTCILYNYFISLLFFRLKT